MPLIPALKTLLDSLPAAQLLDPSDLAGWRAGGLVGANALAAAVVEPARDVGRVSTARVPVAGGEITVRIYEPVSSGPHPIHLYYHGGGFIGATIEEDFVDIACRERAALAGYVTVAVEYRLAPEHPFPIPLEDSYAALLWVVKHANEYDADPERVTVGGLSAGANLAAAVALKARDEKGPAISFQLLEVPALDLTATGPGYELYGGGEYPLATAEVLACLSAYLASPEDARNPYASPLLAEDLSELPPAHIMSSEFDVVQFDGSRYAERLNAAGVAATFSLGRGHAHGSSQYTKLLPEAVVWRDEAIATLRAHADDRVTAVR